MPDSLASWLDYIERIHPKTIEMGLGRLEPVRRRMGLYPEFPIVTVAGTNGKGSTCAMLEAILRQAGYKVGCYTSPHLVRFNERIRIAGVEAEDEAITMAFSQVEQAREGASLTYFEFSTLAAVALFASEKVDIAILEVGLGGRLDAVNLFDADCAVITGIDYDHMDYLGNTRDEIGFEKAGIFRKGKPAICADFDAPQSVLDHAQEIGAGLLGIGADFGFSRDEGSWSYRGPEISRRHLPFPALRGAFQLSNASAALAALDALNLDVGEDAIAKGFSNLKLPGRFQILPGNPMVVLDVAHNLQAAGMLAANLHDMPCNGKTIAIFGMLADKDIEGVVNTMQASIDEWLIVALNAPRGANIERLRHAFPDRCAVKAFPSVGEARDHACATASENDRIVVFGSFYTVADFMRLNTLCQRS
ncbi:MAG: bifunctional tetrahydrofolate synthase/dihydrofolate synthase [Burkholderiales bacterium]